MAFYTDESGRVVDDGQRFEDTKRLKDTTALSLAKVFGYMFAGLLITGLVAFGLAFLFYRWMLVDEITATEMLFWLMIGSCITTIILSIIISFHYIFCKLLI